MIHGQALLPDLKITDSSEALLTGRAPPFRLSVRAVHRSGEPFEGVAFALSEPFVVSPPRRLPPLGWAARPCCRKRVGSRQCALPPVGALSVGGRGTVQTLHPSATTADVRHWHAWLTIWPSRQGRHAVLDTPRTAPAWAACSPRAACSGCPWAPPQVATARVKGAAKLEIPHVDDHVSKIDCVGLQVRRQGSGRSRPGARAQRAAPISRRGTASCGAWRRAGGSLAVFVRQELYMPPEFSAASPLSLCRPRRSWRTSRQQPSLQGFQTSTFQ